MIVLARRSLADCSPIHHYGRDSSSAYVHIHDLHMDGKLKACDLFKMVHLEVALHFFFLHYVDVLKTLMRAHFIFFFKTYLSLDLLHFLRVATLTPTNGSSIAYG